MESNYTKIGSLQKSFGTAGFLKYKVFPNYSEELKDAAFLFLQHDDYYVPYRILNFEQGKRLIQFDDIDNQEKASSIQKSFLPDEADENTGKKTTQELLKERPPISKFPMG